MCLEDKSSTRSNAHHRAWASVRLSGVKAARSRALSLVGILFCLVGIVCQIGFFSSPVYGAETDDRIVLGMSTALTGPAADLGLHVKAGVNAAFAQANARGGINHRTLELIALDDGYEPARTAPNMRQLIENDHVLAVIGNVGTPTAIAAIPIALEKHTPFFGAFTGAGVLRRTPPDRYVINYRASYAEETAAMVDALIEYGGLKPNQVAFFTQRDAYGDAGYVGGITALKAHGLKDEIQIAHGRYERNTLAVENGLADIIQSGSDVKAVIMVGAYAPCARFIQLAHELDFDVTFLNVSFVGASSLAESLGAEGDGVIVTQVVPPFDSDLPIARGFRKAMVQIGAEQMISSNSFEGYVAARILLRALSQIDGRPTRENLVDALEGLGEFDIGLGRPLHLDSREHQACHQVWPTVIEDGQVVRYEWKSLKPGSPETLTAAAEHEDK